MALLQARVNAFLSQSGARLYCEDEAARPVKIARLVLGAESPEEVLHQHLKPLRDARTARIPRRLGAV